MGGFGRILEEWERLRSEEARQSRKPPKRNDEVVDGNEDAQASVVHSAMTAWLARTPDFSEAARDDGVQTGSRMTLRDIEAMPVDAVLDLHGMTAREAETALERFFAEASTRRLRKVIVIQGKGTHSADGAVLPGVVRRFLERSPFAGRSGYADRTAGGRGAVWVMVRSYFSR